MGLLAKLNICNFMVKSVWANYTVKPNRNTLVLSWLQVGRNNHQLTGNEVE